MNHTYWKAVLLLLLFSVAAFGGIPSDQVEELDPKLELDKFVIEEVAKINKVAPFVGKILKSKTLETQADPVRGAVILNFVQLDKYAKDAEVKQLRQFLILILAHETTHLVQTSNYPDYRTNTNPERSRIWECQADIMAGKYLSEIQGDPDPEDNEAIIDALKVTHKIAGTSGFGDSTHPTNEQRRTAVQLGMAAGLIERLSKLERKPALDSMIWTIAEKIDRTPGEHPMVWSYRVARRIVHSDDLALKDVAVTNSEFVWDTNPDNPFVTYDFAFRNSGNKPIKLELEFQVALVLRADADDTLQWKKWSVKNYTVRLKPGEQFSAKDKLPWGGVEELGIPGLDLTKFMPRFIAPFIRKTALYSAQYEDSSEFLFEVSQLKNAIDTLRRAANNRFKAHWLGGAVKEGDVSIYQSSVEIPGSHETRIYVPSDDAPFVSIGLYTGTDPRIGEQRFNQLVEKIRAAYPSTFRSEVARTSNGVYERSIPTIELPDGCWLKLIFQRTVSNNSSDLRLVLYAPFPKEQSQADPLEGPGPSIESIEAKQQRLALEVLNSIVARNYDKLGNIVRSDIATPANIETLAQQWTGAIQFHGPFRKHFDPIRIKHNGLDAISIICEMERSNVKFLVVFDNQSMVWGIWFMPAA